MENTLGKAPSEPNKTIASVSFSATQDPTSSHHFIGEIFDNVYREADLVSPPGHSIQTTLVPAGGATVVEFSVEVPGTYTLVDHAIFRVEKGAVAYLEVEGEPRHDIYTSDQEAVLCEGCMVHP